MMSQRCRRISALAVGATLVAVALWRRLPWRARLPHRARWERELATRCGPQASRAALDRSQEIYTEFRAHCRLPAHPALHYHVSRQILPALAAYRALTESGVSRDDASNRLETLIWSEVEPVYSLGTAFLKRLSRPFPAWRRIVRLAMRTIFPSAGWERRQVRPAGWSFGFDITRCVYLDTLDALGAAELTPLFCRMDDRLAGLIPDSIAWERTGTLATGFPCCDFRWREKAGIPPVPRASRASASHG